MKVFVLLLLTFLLFASSSRAQSAEAARVAVEPTILRIENEKIFEIKTSDLAKLPRRTINVKDHDVPATFEGVDLRDVLKLAAVKLGGNQLRGKELANFVLIEAADGYRAVFALAELDADFTDKIVLLVDKRDGKPLSKNEGILRLVVPDEKKHGRWVRQIVAIKIKRAE